ncbi:MAG: NeuD/PglB/VioB family sugar acetyltransferase [Phycisphaerales bacterium]|nr:NeuD/PglB/VioB family sugar acetyltransferase [Phycisphaerales bacterium]
MASNHVSNTLGEIVLVGGGGHALVVAEACRASGGRVFGVYDDDERCEAAREPDGAEWLGPLLSAGELARPWILSLGDLGMRARVIQRLGPHTPDAQRVVHPAAVIASTASVARGVFVGPLALVHSRAAIGVHAIINSAAIVEHDCTIGENAHLAPRSVLGGGVRIGPGTLVGLGAVVLPGLTVGAGCVVGAGAVVRRHVPDGSRVVGVPATPID